VNANACVLWSEAVAFQQHLVERLADREGVEGQQRDLFGIDLMAFPFFIGHTGDNSHNSNAVFVQPESNGACSLLRETLGKEASKL
jgi:hypothetical protein